jgi:hypothetical protein
MVSKDGKIFNCCGCTPVEVDLECIAVACFEPGGFNPCFQSMTIANPAPSLGLSSIWWEGAVRNGNFNSADTVLGSGDGLGIPQDGTSPGSTCGGTDADWPLRQTGGVTGITNSGWGLWTASGNACPDGHGGLACHQTLIGTLYFCVCGKSPAP